MVKYNVLRMDFNTKQVVNYDVMPYFYDAWECDPHFYDEDERKMRKPETLDEFVKWFTTWARRKFWRRTEYEHLMVMWPCDGDSKIADMPHEKIDVFRQMEGNIDLVASLMWAEVSKASARKTAAKRVRKGN